MNIVKLFISFLLFVPAILCPAQTWYNDTLGDGYQFRFVQQPDDYSGKVRSTIIRRLPAPDKRNGYGVIYIHGFNDYFFQKELGEQFNNHGYCFYAVDLRKYGRSLIHNQKPFQTRSLKEYFPDIDSALCDITKLELKGIALIGHSTGGLLAAYYLEASDSHLKRDIDMLILNSPFLDWNLGKLEKYVGLASSLGSIFPRIKISTGSGDAYSSSLLKSKKGEWTYDTSLKHPSGVTMDLGWVRAINRAQKYVKSHPYAIKIPILLMYSAKSSDHDHWVPESSSTDGVLDVNDIKKYGAKLGHDVTFIRVNGGLHDLILSRPQVRYPLYKYIFGWMNTEENIIANRQIPDSISTNISYKPSVILTSNLTRSTCTMKQSKYHLPKLPYTMDALAPAISAETINYHYGKHEQAYIDNLNKMIEGTDYADMELEDIIRNSEGPLFNNASQAWNHIFYFFTFSPEPQSTPDGKLYDAIVRDFGSIEKFKTDFTEAGTKIFGSGWVWLASDIDGHLMIIQKSGAGNPLTDELTPLLTFDVWEHAYYLDYQNRRAQALEKLWDFVDWSIVGERYENR